MLQNEIKCVKRKAANHSNNTQVWQKLQSISRSISHSLGGMLILEGHVSFQHIGGDW